MHRRRGNGGCAGGKYGRLAFVSSVCALRVRDASPRGGGGDVQRTAPLGGRSGADGGR